MTTLVNTANISYVTRSFERVGFPSPAGPSVVKESWHLTVKMRDDPHVLDFSYSTKEERDAIYDSILFQTVENEVKWLEL